MTWDRKNKLSPEEVCILIHKMWHAKQDEIIHGEGEGLRTHNERLLLGDAKTRLYLKNNEAYIEASRHNYSRYYAQVIETEALAVQRLFIKRLENYNSRKRGEKVIDLSSAQI